MEWHIIEFLNFGVNSLKWNKLKYISKLSSIPPLIWSSEIALWPSFGKELLWQTHFAVRTLINFLLFYWKNICFRQDVKIICVSFWLLSLVGWLVGFGFNGPLRQYFSLYRAVSQREGEREERIDESKNVQTTPPAPTASAIGPCPTVIKIVGRPGTGSDYCHLLHSIFWENNTCTQKEEECETVEGVGAGKR